MRRSASSIPASKLRERSRSSRKKREQRLEVRLLRRTAEGPPRERRENLARAAFLVGRRRRAADEDAPTAGVSPTPATLYGPVIVNPGEVRHRRVAVLRADVGVVRRGQRTAHEILVRLVRLLQEGDADRLRSGLDAKTELETASHSDAFLEHPPPVAERRGPRARDLPHERPRDFLEQEPLDRLTIQRHLELFARRAATEHATRRSSSARA